MSRQRLKKIFTFSVSSPEISLAGSLRTLGNCSLFVRAHVRLFNFVIADYLPLPFFCPCSSFCSNFRSFSCSRFCSSRSTSALVRHVSASFSIVHFILMFSLSLVGKGKEESYTETMTVFLFFGVTSPKGS